MEAAKRLFHLDVPHALLEAWDERLHKEWKGEFARRLGPDGGDPGHDAPESGEEADHRGLEERGAFQVRSCHGLVIGVETIADGAWGVCVTVLSDNTPLSTYCGDASQAISYSDCLNHAQS